MFIELQRGHSFKGVAQYCLHDADRRVTSDRVDFVEVRNLATENPQVAWRLMTAKHYAQNDLKRQAGVGLGGPKDGKPVGHMFISWGRDEAEAQQLDQQEMLYAAKGALRAIGAEEYPSMIVAHTDTKHPHCHIICCLIGDDGRLKKNWKEKENLSRYAMDREIEVHGEPVVKLRERNWKHREAGEKTETKKKQARHLYELDKAAEKDEQIKAFADKHREQLKKLMQRKEGRFDEQGNRVQEGMKVRHKQHQDRLHWCHQERLRRLESNKLKEQKLAERKIRKSYDTPWQELFKQQEANRVAFRKSETTLMGRAYNILRYTNWKEVFKTQAKEKEEVPTLFSRAFNAISSSGHRQQQLAKQQLGEQLRLRAEQQQLENLKSEQLKTEQRQKAEATKIDYVRKAEAMKQRQRATQQQIRQEQQRLTRERNTELRASCARVKAEKELRVREQTNQKESINQDFEINKKIDLTKEANAAFSDTEKAIEKGDSKSPKEALVKSERTRKRKDPSERINRRHTKDRPKEVAHYDQLRNLGEKEDADRFINNHKEQDRDHER